MGIVNILGIFDDVGSKAKMMIICTTIISFFDYCIDNEIEPKIDEIIKYVKNITGIELSEGLTSEFLDILLGNVKLFMMFMINEQCEKISDDVLDNPSTLFGFLRRSI